MVVSFFLCREGVVMKNRQFDLVVIGGGAGGLVSSKFANGLGKKVALIEKEKLGGECTWTGCVPSKTLIHVANMFSEAKKMQKFGVRGIEEASIDTTLVMDHVRQTREGVYKAGPPENLEAKGIKFFSGSARFFDSNTVMVGDTKITAKKFIITTGSSPFIPPVKGVEDIDYLTNQNFFELKKLPASLLILGGGPIGSELSCALNKLGVKVTVIEMLDHILVHEDEELATLLQEKLRERGVTILTGHTVNGVKQQADQVVAICQKKNGEEVKVSAEKLLIATGRKPNIEGLDLEKAGVKYDRRAINVDRTLRTSNKNIYACGDVVGPYQFSHMAEYQAIIATRNALFPFSKKVNYTNRAWTTFTDPEFASIGIHEQEARQRYGEKRVRVYRTEYKEVDRAVCDGSDFGVAKFVCDKKGNLLGAQILGKRAGEIIHEVQLGRTLGVNFAKFDSVIHVYPTYCDLVKKGARKCRIDLLKNNFFIRLLSKLFKKNRQEKD